MTCATEASFLFCKRSTCPAMTTVTPPAQVVGNRFKRKLSVRMEQTREGNSGYVRLIRVAETTSSGAMESLPKLPSKVVNPQPRRQVHPRSIVPRSPNPHQRVVTALDVERKKSRSKSKRMDSTAVVISGPVRPIRAARTVSNGVSESVKCRRRLHLQLKRAQAARDREMLALFGVRQAVAALPEWSFD